jgi:DNA polymerase-1
LDEVYAHIQDIPARYATKLIAGKDSAYLSKTLATIKLDVPITLKLDKARTDHINIPAVEALFRELEFRTLIPKMHNVIKSMGGQTASGGQLSLFGQEIKEVGLPSS